MRRTEQKWILDALIAKAGIDVLHPESRALFEKLGYEHTDAEEVFSRIKCTDMVTKSWAQVAKEVERKARWHEALGHALTARDCYLRAALLYGRAQYSIFRDTEEKAALHGKMVSCYRKVMEYTPTPVERVEVPFQGKTLYGVLHLPRATGKVPCILLIPGMDMFKEDWHLTAQSHILSRGMAALALDGPGQGESLLRGLKVTLNNYEEAGKAVVDYLVSRPEIDGDRVVLLGTSMGSYWGPRVAAYDSRIKACATSMGCYGSKHIIFNVAQPSFKRNYMYMAGIEREEEFDRMADLMILDDIAPKLTCPLLMVHGEYDELNPLQDALDCYARVRAPKEIWVAEDQFHPLGKVAPELFPSIIDWLQDRLEGKSMPRERQVWIRRNGEYREGMVREPLIE